MAQIEPSITRHVQRMETNAISRDSRMIDVRKVRDGELQSLWPDQFSEKYPKAIVANFIDTVARDLAEVMAPLPKLSCSAGAMRTDADKRRAERKNRIGEWGWRCSKFQTQMFFGADQYITYGFLPGIVEPNTKDKRPRIQVLDPTGCYYELDRDLKVTRFFRVWEQDAQELASQFPEASTVILIDPSTRKPYEATRVKVVHWIDDTDVTLFLPDRQNTILATYRHKMSRPPVEIAIRPGLHHDPRGQFDDVLWVQLARSVMAQLTLEAGHKAVQGPVVMPTDVVELNIGPDAIIQTDKGVNSVGRVSLHVPQEAFALGQQLDLEMKTGARYPDARLGQVDASVITGKGVQAMMGGFDTQIKTGQEFLGLFTIGLTELYLEMDELWWPSKTERITGSLSGESYELSYTPRKDIAGNYTCDVTYGFAAGMSPQNAIVTMLQAAGAGLVSKWTLQKQLPWGTNPDEENRNMDVEKTQEAILQGLFAALQSSGQMMASGQTSEAMMFFQAADAVVKGRQNGQPVNEVLMQVFQQFQQQQAQAQQAAQGAAGGPGGPPGAPGGDGTPGVGPDGLPPNVSPGQAGMPPGGMPSIAQLVSGFGSSGQANMTASVRRRLPVQ